MTENDKKREQILESAIRRFSHFGVQKTTMNEIADDIAVSQPSLYYYFPDKTSLIVAVVEKILNEYFTDFGKSIEGIKCLKDLFLQLIEFRRNFIKKFFMMHLTDASADAIIRENCNEMLQNARLREVAIIAEFIKMSITREEIDIVDPEKAGALFLDSLTGLSMWVISRSNKKIYPESEQWDLMVSRQKELAEVFLRSLKYRNRNTCEV